MGVESGSIVLPKKKKKNQNIWIKDLNYKA